MKKIQNIYTVYEIVLYCSWSNDHTLRNCLFVADNFAKNSDIDKCKNSGGTDRNVKIFGVDMSSFTKIDNRKKDILIFGKGPTQGLKHALYTEKIYLINSTKQNKNFLWACIIMEQIVIYLLMVNKFINSKLNILRL